MVEHMLLLYCDSLAQGAESNAVWCSLVDPTQSSSMELQLRKPTAGLSRAARVSTTRVVWAPYLETHLSHILFEAFAVAIWPAEANSTLLRDQRLLDPVATQVMRTSNLIGSGPCLKRRNWARDGERFLSEMHVSSCIQDSGLVRPQKPSLYFHHLGPRSNRYNVCHRGSASVARDEAPHPPGRGLFGSSRVRESSKPG